MENKELKIQVPVGYEIDKENSTFEKIIFKKDEKWLPKTWEDLQNIKGSYVDKDSIVCNCAEHNTSKKIGIFSLQEKKQKHV